MKKPAKKSRDVNQIAKLVVDLSTSESPPTDPPTAKKNPNAVALGKLGGAKGGPARAKKLTAQQRSEIAKRAATARWGKQGQKSTNS